jgi:hypothetical protein
MPFAMKREAESLLAKLDNDDITPAKFREMRDDIVGRCPGAFLYAPEFDG